MPDMKPFWRIVGAAAIKYSDPIFDSEGYLRIVAHGVEYRSLPDATHGIVEWISWEPYEKMAHFSTLTDPDATVEWVSAIPQGDTRRLVD